MVASRPMATTAVELHRVGSNSSARLDSLRNTDVQIYTEATESEICVRATSTVSCWDSSAQLVMLRGRPWRLPINSQYDDTRLLLWEDFPGSGHWNWTPARDMPGSEYLSALRAVNGLFIL